MIGRTLSHYRIISRLGAGGMGEVYLADDTRLGRKVALKVLPEAVAEDPERLRRLEREARTLGALDHPNIVTVFSVEEAEGVHFLTMAHVSGETLDEAIPEQGLPVGRLVEIAIALADALRSAHARGVVHRDLKPGNVMIDDEGRVRVLDFGLAKLIGEPSDPESAEQPTMTMTAEGTVVGTVPYMSPEQVAGRPVDARSDLFSLGVMLYEMATGQRPFRGETALAVASAILKEEPRSLAEERPELPARLRSVIGRCLKKEPGERVQTADELLDELREIRRELESLAMAATTVEPVSPPTRPGSRRGLIAAACFTVVVLGAFVLDLGGIRRRIFGAGKVSGAEVAAPIRSLAVLPLANLSSDPSQEYLVDGMTEALIADLSKIGALKVISRTSVMRFKKTDRTLPEIASELGVEAVVEGSIVREANRVRVNAQLIHAATDRHLWSESYERELSSVLALQSEIARAIAREIEVQLTPQEEDRFATTRTVDPEAYQDYLRGVFHRNRFTPAEFETALRFFRSAIEKDPNEAAAHTGAGSIWAYRLVLGLVPQAVACPLWSEELTRALALDPDSAEARVGNAQHRTVCAWDWPGADADFRRAIELNPGYAEARMFYANFLGAQRRFEEGQVQMRLALELDPLNAFYRAGYGVQLAMERRFQEAVIEFERSLELDPGGGFVHLPLASALKLTGREQEAVVQLATYLSMVGETAAAEALRSGAEAGGYREGALRAAEALAADSGLASSRPMLLVYLFDDAGETERALDWLQTAYEVRDLDMAYLATTDVSNAILTDERYKKMLRQLDLPIPPPLEAIP